jgi:hypothetical protein
MAAAELLGRGASRFAVVEKLNRRSGPIPFVPNAFRRSGGADHRFEGPAKQ